MADGARMGPSGIEEALPPAGSLAGGEQAVPTPRAARLPLARKLGYSAGQLVELIVGSMLNMFALFYMTAVCGLPGGLAGLALGAGLVVDAIVDPLIGSLSDGWKSRFGRRVPFMAFGLVPLIVAFNLIFALPATLGTVGLTVWLTVLSICLRVSLSMFALPYQALGAELSDDYAERSSIAAWRWGVGILGTVAVIGLAYGLFLGGPGGISRRAAYLPLTLTLTAIIIAGALTAIRTGLATRQLQRETAAPTQALHRRLFGEMAEMFRNRTFRIVFCASLLVHVGMGFNQALALHVGVFYWSLVPGQMQALAMAAVLGLALAAPLTGLVGGHVEKRTMLIIGTVGMALCQGAPAALRLLGLLPFTGDVLTALLAGVSFLNGIMFALSVIGFISVMPDAADEHEHLFGTRREGLYFAGWLFASKAASGGGLLIAGVVLQLIHFPANASATAAAATSIPEVTAAWLGFAGGPGAGLIALLGGLVMLFYRVNRKAHALIMTDLVARRGA